MFLPEIKAPVRNHDAIRIYNQTPTGEERSPRRGSRSKKSSKGPPSTLSKMSKKSGKGSRASLIQPERQMPTRKDVYKTGRLQSEVQQIKYQYSVQMINLTKLRAYNERLGEQLQKQAQ